MATLTDSAIFATDGAARLPVIAAYVQAAVSIAFEDSTTEHHEERVALAYEVLANPTSLADQFTWAMSTNATVVDEWVAGNTEQAISDMSFVLTTIWDAVALARAAQHA